MHALVASALSECTQCFNALGTKCAHGYLRYAVVEPVGALIAVSTWYPLAEGGDRCDEG